MQALKIFLKSTHFVTILFFSALCLLFFTGFIDLPENQSLRAAKASIPGPSLKPDLGHAHDDFSAIVEEGHTELRGTLVAGDTLSKSFSRNNVPHQIRNQIFRSLKNQVNLNSLRPGDSYSIILDAEGQLVKCVYEINPFLSYTVKPDETGIITERNDVLLEARTVKVSGIITSSLFSAFPAGIKSPRIIYAFADVFSSKIDFNTETRNGDSFSLIVDEYYRFDEFVGYGPIVAARYERENGEIIEAFRYGSDDVSTNYYDRDGNELGASFIRSPVPIGRITSRFSYRRLHPILGVIKKHLGVDLAAPRGTPVMAAADGKVVFAGANGGFGKQLVIAHPGDYRTHYGHLSRFSAGLQKGSIIKQKQVIGYVGSTGLATGPHLDYRLQHHGIFKNPFAVKFQPKSTLQSRELELLKLRVAELSDKLLTDFAGKIISVRAISLSGDQHLALI